MGREIRKLSFSVRGETITMLARDRLYDRNDLLGALELIMDCTMTDQLTEEKRFRIAFDILDGKKEIVGVYPGETYGIRDCEEQDPVHNIKAWQERINVRLKRLENENREWVKKMICIGENLDIYEKRKINAAWKNEYDGNEIFEDALQTIPYSELLQSALERMSCSEEDDYGWLEPSGKFHPADWGHHQSFARDWLEQNDPEFNPGNPKYCYPGDILVDRGWILLHNPAQGVAFVTQSDTKQPTKAQREFLYDYYMKRNHPEKANAFMSDDT